MCIRDSLWCSGWHAIVILFPLHLMPVWTLCRTPQAAALCLCFAVYAGCPFGGFHEESNIDLRLSRQKCCSQWELSVEASYVCATTAYHERYTLLRDSQCWVICFCTECMQKNAHVYRLVEVKRRKFVSRPKSTPFFRARPWKFEHVFYGPLRRLT